ncbi:hypothetical protein DFH08DRAFT_881975 [Mycena albidolilacea]|uniref:Uncharacterized protein n=1 Tax=Mycena albidolilacea TaxID=1033008 RepID=A0AAD7EKU6_9AGAR|nr:hypothetical protein DFH08DRAFT_881975 [Mycena albidolilacea]
MNRATCYEATGFPPYEVRSRPEINHRDSCSTTTHDGTSCSVAAGMRHSRFPKCHLPPPSRHRDPSRPRGSSWCSTTTLRTGSICGTVPRSSSYDSVPEWRYDAADAIGQGGRRSTSRGRETEAGTRILPLVAVLSRWQGLWGVVRCDGNTGAGCRTLYRTRGRSVEEEEHGLHAMARGSTGDGDATRMKMDSRPVRRAC